MAATFPTLINVCWSIVDMTHLCVFVPTCG